MMILKRVEQTLELIQERAEILPSLIQDLGVFGSIYEVEEYLVGKHGADVLGSGNFASVYAGSSGGYVIKVAKNDKAYQKFYNIAKDYQHNPIFPKFVDGAHNCWKGLCAYGMERINVDVSIHKRLEANLRKIAGGRDFHNLAIAITKPLDDLDYVDFRGDVISWFDKNFGQGYYDHFDEFVNIVNRIGVLDIWYANYGLRRSQDLSSMGELVIFDPVA